MNNEKHIPVLLDAVMAALGDINGKSVIDATFGAGGYSQAFLSAGATVTAFDRDSNVVGDARVLSDKFGSRFEFVPRPFSHIAELQNTYDAIVFDLGISSMQIDVASRGFSFRFDGPLDMRMSDNGITASELIINTPVDQLAKILRDYGDIKNATRLARIIHDAAPQTTFELKSLIHDSRDVAPVFQALRIAVNDELGELERALDAVPKRLNPGGKCICVTFHSTEDRIVKNTFRKWTSVSGDPRLPDTNSAPFTLIKTMRPDDAETQHNPRARSAHMRGVIKSY